MARRRSLRDLSTREASREDEAPLRIGLAKVLSLPNESPTIPATDYAMSDSVLLDAIVLTARKHCRVEQVESSIAPSPPNSLI